MRPLLRIAWAYLRRDFQSAGPWQWVVDGLDGGLSVLFWYFVAKYLGGIPHFSTGPPSTYFAYTLIGLALSQYVWRGFSLFANRLKTDQASGSFGPLWVTRNSFSLLVILSGLSGFVSATLNAGMILATGSYVFGVPLPWQGIPGLVGVGFLTSLSMGSLGLLSASWILASGRGDFFRPVLTKTIPLLSGAFFPIALFPEWLERVAWCLPFTHALQLARGELLPSAGIDLKQAWLALIGITACLALGGWLTLSFALRVARANGRIAAR